MAGFGDKVASGMRSGLKFARVKSKEAVGVVNVRRQLARAQQERRSGLEALGNLVCEMLDEGQIDEATLRTHRARIAEISERIMKYEGELEGVHEKAADELARD